MTKSPLILRAVCAGVLALAPHAAPCAGSQKEPATAQPVHDGLAALRNAVQAHPEDFSARQALATKLAEARLWDEAAAQAKEMVARRPSEKTAWALLGEADIQQEHWKEGVEEISKAHALGFDSPESFLQLSEGLIALGRSDEAEKVLTNALATNPKNAGAMAELGKLRQKQWRFMESNTLSKQAIEIDPKNVLALMNLANNCVTENQPTDAIRYAQRALEADPHSWRSLSVMGMAEEQRSRPEAALAAYRKATEMAGGQFAAWQGVARMAPDYEEASLAARKTLELAPENPAVQALIGYTQRRFGKIEQAIFSYKDALSKNPENAVVAEELNSLLMAQGRAEEALGTCMLITKERPNWPVGWRLLGEDCMNIGRYAEAESVLKKAIDLDPHNSVLWSDLGSTLVAAATAEDSVGRAVEAEKALQKALQFDPNNSAARLHLPLALIAQHRVVEAEELCRKSLELDGRSAEGWLILGKTRFMLGRFDKAIEADENAIRLAPMETPYWKELQECYQRRNNNAEAEVKLKKLLTEFPKAQPGWVSLGIVLAAGGKNEAAADAYRKAIALDENNPDAWNGMGVAQANLGQTQDAIESFKKAVQASPGYSEAWGNIGYMYFQQGKLAEAIEVYHRALQINPRNTLALGNLVTAAAKLGDMEAAQKACDQLAEINPPYAEKLRAQLLRK